MKQSNFKTIESVSRQFEMSQVWLHQLRIKGFIDTKCVRSVNGRQHILYNADDIEKWIENHNDAYQHRRSHGCFDKVSLTTIIPIT